MATSSVGKMPYTHNYAIFSIRAPENDIKQTIFLIFGIAP
jgi:transketolase C-terminal domain/subunit